MTRLKNVERKREPFQYGGRNEAERTAKGKTVMMMMMRRMALNFLLTLLCGRTHFSLYF